MSVKVQLKIPEQFAAFEKPARYKVAYGGRGGGRSWTMARMLLWRAIAGKIRILCAREFQTSIADSVHRLLSDQITSLGLDMYFEVTQKEIRSVSGSVFLFKGLRHNASEIKSMEGVNICWVEEGHNVSPDSWDYLVPTIREPESEIWVSFNPVDEDLETYQRFIEHEYPSIVRVKTTIFDNPFAPQVLLDEAEHDRIADPDRFDWVWLGNPRKLTEASIFGDKVRIAIFDTPEVDRFYYGMDFGFSNDPTTINRSYIVGDTLYIDYEASGVGIEIPELPSLMMQVPGADRWPVVADSSRPETISYLNNHGFRVMSSPKGAGSIEEGIEYLRGYKEIVIHERCRLLASEAKWYSYKVDKATGHILPKPVDAHNHGWDALRYAHAHLMRGARRGSLTAGRLGL